jgi:hypothetical protein
MEQETEPSFLESYKKQKKLEKLKKLKEKMGLKEEQSIRQYIKKQKALLEEENTIRDIYDNDKRNNDPSSKWVNETIYANKLKYLEDLKEDKDKINNEKTDILNRISQKYGDTIRKDSLKDKLDKRIITHYQKQKEGIQKELKEIEETYGIKEFKKLKEQLKKDSTNEELKQKINTKKEELKQKLKNNTQFKEKLKSLKLKSEKLSEMADSISLSRACEWPFG